MTNHVHWHIGKEGTTSTTLDKGPFRAYFFAVRDGMLVDAFDYSQIELRAEIQRRETIGEDIAVYSSALKRLQRV